MACNTCGHTMQAVGSADNSTVHWCPRCGTVRQAVLGLDHVPKIVERCRTFATLLPGITLAPDRVAGEWHSLGIAEAIEPPKELPF